MNTSQQKLGKHLFGKIKRSDFASFHNFIHSSLTSWLVFFILIGALSWTLSYQMDPLPVDIKVDLIAPTDIKADRNYEIIDEKATQVNREEALHSVLPVFDYDANIAHELDQKVEKTFEEARMVLEETEDLAKAKSEFELFLDIQLRPEQLDALATGRFSAEVEQSFRHILSEAMGEWILAGKGELGWKGDGVTLRSLQKEAPHNEETLDSSGKIIPITKMQKLLEERAKNISQQKEMHLPEYELLTVVEQILRPNVYYNSVETDLRRAKAVHNVPSVVIKVKAGEAIIRSGDRYQPHHLTILDGIRKQKTETDFLTKLLGTALFISVLMLSIYVFARKYIRYFSPTRRDLYFLGGVLFFLLIGVRIGAGISTALRDFFPYDIAVQSLYYAIPVAGGAMLVRYILNAETALVFALVASALTGLVLEAPFDLSIYFLLSSVVAASAIAKVDRRSSILWAGVVVGSVNAILILAIKLITVVSITDVFSASEVLLSMFLGFLGGCFTSGFVMINAPLAEIAFNYVTDIKLLELGNLNHPLLRKMIVQAPGTYHHSQLVAVLAEAAAAEIRANPLLARVGSYFHDIGKMRKPSYFIENQQGGPNRHDNLSPSMSALIVAAHVKDGLELAQEYKLPEAIADFIPQHQGTKVISFFYNKAMKIAEEKGETIDEKNYRYPGPRPQTREAGIILLADGVEAAVRSMPEKTPGKIQARVQNIINKNFTEAQLDECDVTLKDLHIISETFTRVLVGIYHQRIAYPEIEEKKATVTPIKEAMITRESTRK